MIRAVIFDCFGVLTTDTWKEFIATLPESQRQQASDLNRAYGGAYVSKPEFLQAIERLTGKLPKDIDDLLDHEIAKNNELLTYITSLKKSYKIGLLSNVASDWIRRHFLSPNEQDLFDSFVLSYEVQLTKPDPRIFTLAADRLAVPIETCILVDDVEYYGKVATQLGMKFVLYRNFPQAKHDIQNLLT